MVWIYNPMVLLFTLSLDRIKAARLYLVNYSLDVVRCKSLSFMVIKK